jgi:hypothetical protein
MVFGVVHFSIERPVQGGAEGETQRVFGEAPLNAMVTGQHNYINAQRLGKAQQLLQLRAAQKINDESFKPEDVIIHAFTYLGHMSEEEFNAQAIVEATTGDVKSASPEI